MKRKYIIFVIINMYTVLVEKNSNFTSFSFFSDQSALPQHLVCRTCGAIFRAEDPTPRIVPKVKFNRLLQRILVRQMHNSHLNNLQETLNNVCNANKQVNVGEIMQFKH